MGSAADAAQWDPTGCICRLDGQLAAGRQRGRFEAAEAAANLTWFGSPKQTHLAVLSKYL